MRSLENREKRRTFVSKHETTSTFRKLRMNGEMGKRKTR
jgi:hypothetical protein